MSVDQTKADDFYNKPSMDTCSECGMQFLSDDEMLDKDDLCHECARYAREAESDLDELLSRDNAMRFADIKAEFGR